MKKFLLSLSAVALMTGSIFAQSITCTISNVNNATCYNMCNGSATANSAGGFAPYTYTWTPGGQTTKTATGLCAGTYTVQTIDSTHYYGIGTATVVIGQPVAITASVTSTQAGCTVANGSATVNPSGGTPPYTYSWSTAPLQVTQTASLLSAGMYSVTVTDAHGCTISHSVAITATSSPSVTATISSNVLCTGYNTGIATANASGGTASYTYLWTPSGANTQTAVNLSVGTYTVKVTDSNGCTATALATITQPLAITTTIILTNPTCNGGNNGTATVTASGGTPAYTYQWNNGQISQTVTGLIAGTYTVQVTDANGCLQMTPVIIIQPAPLNFSVSATSYCVMNPTQLSATGTTTYHWAPSSGLSCTTCANPTANPSVTTTYTLTNSQGCGAAVVTVNVNTPSYPQICISLVDTLSQHNIIVWDKPSSQGTIDSFRIYREVGSFFKPIVTLPYSHLSSYTDTSSSVNPNTSAYSYRISTVSNTNVESTLSNVHETMYLQVSQSAPPVANLTWTDYCGFPVIKYYIYRDGYNTNNWVKIDSANWGTNVYVDQHAPTVNAAYRIEVIPHQPCIISLVNPKNPITDAISLNSSRSNIYRINNANGVNEISLNDLISIYPNPSNGEFQIQANSHQLLANSQIEIYNVLGEKIYQSAIQSFTYSTIDLSSAPSGIYFLQLKTNKGVAVKKIVKE